MADNNSARVALDGSPGRGVLVGVFLGITLWACVLAPVAVLLQR